MKLKVLLFLSSFLLMVNLAHAEVWSYKLKQVQEGVDVYRFIITVYVDRKEVAGREIVIDKTVVDGKTAMELKTQLDTYASQIKLDLVSEQDLKNKMATVIDVENVIP
jgi:hypothetical protein